MQNSAPSNRQTYVGLLVAVLAVAFAAIFVRWAGDTPALIIAFYRMFWATLIFGAGHVISRGSLVMTGLTSSQKWRIVLAGLMLALHFATWISSLKYTTVAHALMLGSTGPVLALVLAPLLLKEKIHSTAVVSVMLSLAGVIIIAGGDLYAPGGAFTGDLLALCSALFVTLYLFIGRSLRASVMLIPYLIRVYGTAAFCLLLAVIIQGEGLLDYPLDVHFWMFMLALVPTGVGHSLFNWAARRIEVYKVNLAGLGEPLLASILAYVFFKEVPYVWFYPGAALVLGGIGMALWKGDKKP